MQTCIYFSKLFNFYSFSTYVFLTSELMNPANDHLFKVTHVLSSMTLKQYLYSVQTSASGIKAKA